MQSVTLNENRDFRRAYAKGKSRVHRLLVTYVLKNRLGVNRVGFTATKKIGKACRRNRARRVIREAYRTLEPQLRQGYDIVFVARGATGEVKMQEVLAVMKSQLGSIMLPQQADAARTKRLPDEKSVQGALSCPDPVLSEMYQSIYACPLQVLSNLLLLRVSGDQPFRRAEGRVSCC